MASRDHTQSQSHTPGIASQVVTAVQNGSTVAIGGYESVSVTFNLGVFGGTTPTATLDIQDSPDGAAWTSVPAGLLVGGALPAITAANANQLIQRGYLGLKPYLRAAVTAIGGTSPSLPMGAVITRGSAKVQPTAGTA